VNAKPLLPTVVFSLRVNELILDLLGSLDEGKCKINAFTHSQEALVNEKFLIKFAPLPCILKFTP